MKNSKLSLIAVGIGCGLSLLGFFALMTPVLPLILNDPLEVCLSSVHLLFWSLLVDGIFTGNPYLNYALSFLLPAFDWILISAFVLWFARVIFSKKSIVRKTLAGLLFFGVFFAGVEFCPVFLEYKLESVLRSARTEILKGLEDKHPQVADFQKAFPECRELFAIDSFSLLKCNNSSFGMVTFLDDKKYKIELRMEFTYDYMRRRFAGADSHLPVIALYKVMGYTEKPSVSYGCRFIKQLTDSEFYDLIAKNKTVEEMTRGNPSLSGADRDKINVIIAFESDRIYKVGDKTFRHLDDLFEERAYNSVSAVNIKSDIKLKKEDVSAIKDAFERKGMKILSFVIPVSVSPRPL